MRQASRSPLVHTPSQSDSTSSTAMVSSRSKVHAWPTTRRTARPSTMSRRPRPFNRLPIELVHHILRMAAASSRRSSLDICLVSSWARRIARPHLFHTIVITDTIALDKCLGCIVNHMPNSNLTVVHTITIICLAYCGPALMSPIWLWDPAASTGCCVVRRLARLQGK